MLSPSSLPRPGSISEERAERRQGPEDGRSTLLPAKAQGALQKRGQKEAEDQRMGGAPRRQELTTATVTCSRSGNKVSVFQHTLLTVLSMLWEKIREDMKMGGGHAVGNQG